MKTYIMSCATASSLFDNLNFNTVWMVMGRSYEEAFKALTDRPEVVDQTIKHLATIEGAVAAGPVTFLTSFVKED